MTSMPSSDSTLSSTLISPRAIYFFFDCDGFRRSYQNFTCPRYNSLVLVGGECDLGHVNFLGRSQPQRLPCLGKDGVVGELDLAGLFRVQLAAAGQRRPMCVRCLEYEMHLSSWNIPSKISCRFIRVLDLPDCARKSLVQEEASHREYHKCINHSQLMIVSLSSIVA